MMRARARGRVPHAASWQQLRSSGIASLLGCAFALGACTPAGKPEVDPQPLVVTDSANGSTLVLQPGQPLEVRLPGNPSTGFRWEHRPGTQGVLRQDGEPRFERADAAPGAVGAGGTEVFRFVPVAPGLQALSFAYRRAWEKEVLPARTLDLEVRVASR